MHDTTEAIKCETCGSDFEVKESRVDDARFCSNDCRATWQASVFEGSDGPGYKGGKEVYECEICIKEFEQWDSQRGTRFCSHGCYTTWMRENAPNGEEHPSWVGGERRYYGRIWGERSGEVRKRDGYECVECGMTNEVHREEYGCSLHVHHKIPVREFDNVLNAHYEGNLVTVCAPCHLKLDQRYRQILGDG